MEAQPWYKRALIAIGLASAAAASTRTVREFPLSADPERKPTKYRPRKGKKGCFGKCRYRLGVRVVTDPKFNHSLQPSRVARRLTNVSTSIRGMTSARIAFWLWVIIGVAVTVAIICG